MASTTKYKQKSDEEIVLLIINSGNQELFELIYLRYFKKVRDKCFSFLKDSKLSEEFANDILTKAYEKIHGFKGNSSFSSWLYSITYNYCIDYLRVKKKLHYPEWNSNNEIPEIIDESETDFEEASYENLLTIFELIHPEEKVLLLMKYQDNLPIKSIAKTLRISEDAVKMRLKRARSRVIYMYNEKFNSGN
ncbi:RNA polymerase sigma-70 factor, ECF subfamily [Aquipluma nitroreducens]|uniref:RNA polymerase sigma-70 factor, ECF subfamily n=1 Tax=Aquipluma nitroreducens TaxID=2010828 RepID=A0A5K7SDF9_9BACT|nr:RNA polymerase sigma factor [Aquipluma nitroreducens]BBE19641.1 RNA polymerase sigma-70 factor, ECF subfamily [Aquipluma nitroreducens]